MTICFRINFIENYWIILIYVCKSYIYKQIRLYESDIKINLKTGINFV